ncbi:MAG: class I tRNA ligase family protein, partial [Victivallales bacterium]
KIVHQYPHCWRCKSPIIFRATPQWFCSVEAFRDKAITACENVEWLPSWGEDRMISMIKERSDWCISRQRHWGLPIPAFYCKNCGEIICDEKTINKISAIFANESSNAWFAKDETELLPEGYVCPKCGGVHFVKETDTLDGWFDSGSTHFAVLENDDNLTWPADLYLEGADQYRGWFQSSLLTAIGAKGKGAPYKQILTHGWVVDGEGKAMHKSLGNSIAPEEIINKYGADMLRLWVAASDYRADVRASDEIFKQLSESYRKIRNTLRILLANLGDGNDFDPDRDYISPEKLEPLDKWLLSKLNRLVKLVNESYDSYEFHIIYHEIHNFCSIDLSKIYVDITKDRMYCEKKDSVSRRAAQTVMYEAASALIKMLAPILSFTAEEAWGYLPHGRNEDARSVFLNRLPVYDEANSFASVEESYNRLFVYRDTVLKALEAARAAKVIGKPLDADVIMTADAAENSEALKVFEEHKDALAEIFITSKAETICGKPDSNAFYDDDTKLYVSVVPAAGEKCVRCWKSGEGYETDSDGQHLCARCRKAVC